MSGDLEARVVQAALDVVAWRYDDRGYDMVAACIRDPDHARGLGTTVMKEVEFAILGARAALAEIDVIGLMTAAYAAGFKQSGEGYNAEYPFDDEFESDDGWTHDRDNEITRLLNKRPAAPRA